jgi:hypothetical protein
VLVSATWKPTKAELHVTVGEERVEVEVGPLLSFINFVSSFYMSFYVGYLPGLRSMAPLSCL